MYYTILSTLQYDAALLMKNNTFYRMDTKQEYYKSIV